MQPSVVDIHIRSTSNSSHDEGLMQVERSGMQLIPHLVRNSVVTRA